ncbi:hypothetical protein LJR230_003877 [Trinickia sp. LjRoot230]|uniref:hypothetical protein n=1 Tax=Trinickia sp. LjRoot230 TaxID=3342288 RepID=UPI003ECF327F
MRASNIGGGAPGLGPPDDKRDPAQPQRLSATPQQNVAGSLGGLSRIHRPPPNAFPRNARETLLSALGPGATLVSPPGDSRTFVVQFEGQAVRLHVYDIKASTEMTYVQVEGEPELFESEPADDISDVLIGWDDRRQVYCVRSMVQTGIGQTGFAYIDDKLLDEARWRGIASRTVRTDGAVVGRMFAVPRAGIASALRQFLASHQPS